jgi:phosphoribosylformylglycinamidine synthase
MEVQLNGISEEEAQTRVKEMCEKLFANTVIESYRFTLDSAE